jgi:hypothetical protein
VRRAWWLGVCAPYSSIVAMFSSSLPPWHLTAHPIVTQWEGGVKQEQNLWLLGI